MIRCWPVIRRIFPAASAPRPRILRRVAPVGIAKAAGAATITTIACAAVGAAVLLPPAPPAAESLPLLADAPGHYAPAAAPVHIPEPGGLAVLAMAIAVGLAAWRAGR